MIDEREIAAAGFKAWGLWGGMAQAWHDATQNRLSGELRLDRFRHTRLRASFDGINGEPADDFKGAMRTLALRLRGHASYLRRQADALDAAAARADVLAGGTDDE